MAEKPDWLETSVRTCVGVIFSLKKKKTPGSCIDPKNDLEQTIFHAILWKVGPGLRPPKN